MVELRLLIVSQDSDWLKNAPFPALTVIKSLNLCPPYSYDTDDPGLI